MPDSNSGARDPRFGELSPNDAPWVRFSGRSKGGPLDVPRPAERPDGQGDRAPLDVPHGEGFGTGC